MIQVGGEGETRTLVISGSACRCDDFEMQVRAMAGPWNEPLPSVKPEDKADKPFVWEGGGYRIESKVTGPSRHALALFHAMMAPMVRAWSMVIPGETGGKRPCGCTEKS